jgi:YHS domain-containing protein
MAQAIDPVCGMTVDTATAKFTTQYQGETFYFCAPGCKKAFEQAPEQYVKQSQQAQEQQTDHHDG